MDLSLTEKKDLHPRNPHRFLYDFKQLTAVCPELAPYVSLNKYNNKSIDFSDPKAVIALNKALLKQFYDIGKWDLPEGYLCPPIPGRADYIHYIADLLSSENEGLIPRECVNVLDIGIGANCVYPIVGHKEYGWHFAGSDIDPAAIASAQKIIDSNAVLTGAVQCRLQKSSSDIFTGIIHPDDSFDLTICNPPFHASAKEAMEGSIRKWKNLGVKKNSDVLNFGGTNTELWTAGGEEAFVRKMIEQSAKIPTQCLWFTSLISNRYTLHAVDRLLKQFQACDVKIIDMAQGQKISRLVAWTFLTQQERKKWALQYWR